MARKNDWMEPRNGQTFRVLIGTRISGCQNQKRQSNVDQEQHAREEIRNYTQCDQLEVHVISCIAKGEWLQREEINDIERELRTGKYDLFIVEALLLQLPDVSCRS